MDYIVLFKEVFVILFEISRCERSGNGLSSIGLFSISRIGGVNPRLLTGQLTLQSNLMQSVRGMCNVTQLAD